MRWYSESFILIHHAYGHSGAATCDNGNLNGGNWPNVGNNDSGNSGPFNVNFNNDASNTNSNLGSRLIQFQHCSALSNTSHSILCIDSGENHWAVPLGKKSRSSNHGPWYAFGNGTGRGEIIGLRT